MTSTRHRQIDWPELKLPPINLWVMPPPVYEPKPEESKTFKLAPAWNDYAKTCKTCKNWGKYPEVA
ncbi:MAG: hypothetical protein KGZ88_11775 [Methylomicrobium sp.]|nr:hypothetical protein [Methylomicrobium sp.]